MGMTQRSGFGRKAGLPVETAERQLLAMHRLVEKLLYRGNGSHHHPFGLEPGDRLRHDARNRFQPMLFDCLRRGHHERRRAVVHPRGVARSHGAVFLEDGLKLRKRFDGRARASDRRERCARSHNAALCVEGSQRKARRRCSVPGRRQRRSHGRRTCLTTPGDQ